METKKAEKRLGKGLEALISGDMAKARERVEKVDTRLLSPNPFQPRKRFSEGKMEELVNSLREKGIIQPILVRSKGDGYEIIAGERRWRAAQILNLEEVPVIVRSDIDDANSLEISLIENIQREELNPVEEAVAYKELIDKLNLPVTELELSVRSNNCLREARIKSIGEIVYKTEQDMLQYRNFGKKSLTEIKEVLKTMGLSFGMDKPKAGKKKGK